MTPKNQMLFHNLWCQQMRCLLQTEGCHRHLAPKKASRVQAEPLSHRPGSSQPVTVDTRCMHH